MVRRMSNTMRAATKQTWQPPSCPNAKRFNRRPGVALPTPLSFPTTWAPQDAPPNTGEKPKTAGVDMHRPPQRARAESPANESLRRARPCKPLRSESY